MSSRYKSKAQKSRRPSKKSRRPPKKSRRPPKKSRRPSKKSRRPSKKSRRPPKKSRLVKKSHSSRVGRFLSATSREFGDGPFGFSMSHSSKYLHAIINKINKIKNSDKATRDYYHYKNNSGLSLVAIKKLLGFSVCRWGIINNALKIGVAKGHLKKTKGRYKVIKIKQSKKKSRKRVKTVAQKRADCKKKKLVYDTNTGRCRARKKPGRKLKKSHVKSRKPKKAVKKKGKMKKSKFKMKRKRKDPTVYQRPAYILSSSASKRAKISSSSSSSPSSSSSSSSHLELDQPSFDMLVQSLINIIPSLLISVNENNITGNYFALDNIFADNFNLCKLSTVILQKPNSIVSYEEFVGICQSVLDGGDPHTVAGLYPVGRVADGGIHYYVVIPTTTMTDGIKKHIKNWFERRGALPTYTQDGEFIENALNSPIVVMNGYMKGDSQLDGPDNALKSISLSANLQTYQGLCAFNAMICGAAFGLPTTDAIRQTAWNTLKPLDNFKTVGGWEVLGVATINERAVLTFLAKMFYDNLINGPVEKGGDFVKSLEKGAGGIYTNLALEQGGVNELMTNLNSVTNYGQRQIKGTAVIADVKGESYVNLFAIIQIILCKDYNTQFAVWSGSEKLSSGGSGGSCNECNTCTFPRRMYNLSSMMLSPRRSLSRQSSYINTGNNAAANAIISPEDLSLINSTFFTNQDPGPSLHNSDDEDADEDAFMPEALAFLSRFSGGGNDFGGGGGNDFGGYDLEGLSSEDLHMPEDLHMLDDV
jgi:hypothetical protein